MYALAQSGVEMGVLKVEIRGKFERVCAHRAEYGIASRRKYQALSK